MQTSTATRFFRLLLNRRILLGLVVLVLLCGTAWRMFDSTRGYHSWVRVPSYVKMRDGTAIAVDVYRPARNGAAVAERLPVLLTDYRYQRAMVDNTRLLTPLDGSERFRSFIKHGYVIAVADLRGAGASFGVSNGPFSSIEASDAYDLTEWLASQPWCSGAVGMFGTSYSGTVQMLAAASAPPHLKAIFPEMFIFDLYEVAYPGGVPRSPFVRNWSKLVDELDKDGRVAPVDDADTGTLARALAEHRQNVTPYQMLERVPYRDSRDPVTREVIFETRNPQRLLSAVNASQIPVYVLSGFDDLWTKDALLWFRNLRVPKKVTVGPWSHNDRAGFDRTGEQLRWFDHWLKNRDTGIMDEARVRYYTSGARPGWRTASEWPPPKSVSRTFAFCAGSTPSSHALCEHPPATTGHDGYRVDYEATTGATSRWASGYGAEFSYPDMAKNDAKLLAYTSSALGSDVEATGHPVVRLWISADVPDIDVVLYLEDVEPGGGSHYVSEGVLRASHRRLSTPGWEYFSLPFHASREQELELLPREPSELRLDLAPVSYRFAAGHRIRIAVAGADRDNLATRVIQPPPSMQVHWGGMQPSALELSVVAQADIRAETTAARLAIRQLPLGVMAGLMVVAVSLSLRSTLRRRFRRNDLLAARAGSVPERLV